MLLVAYGAFGSLVARHASAVQARGAPFRRVVEWTLPIAAVFDALENVLHWWLTEVPRFGVPVVYAISACSSLLKWLIIVGFAVLLACALSRAED